MARDVAIGIDLGTTNSSIAVCHDDGKVIVIPNDQTGLRTTPSYVTFDEDGRSIGSLAKTGAFQNPKNTVFEIKRILGRIYRDPEVARNQKRWPFKVEDSGLGPMISISEMNVSKKISPTEISSMILSNLNAYASKFLGEPIPKVVITVPAKFNDAQRKATREAGRLAGLEVIGMINEPTAAAMGYAVTATANSTFLVFDFGGGTLDVSVIRCNHKLVFEVLATEGDMNLGGADFDERILKYCVKLFKDEHSIDLNDHPSGLAQLRLHCETAKITLSGSSSAFIIIPCVAPNVNFKGKITREKFEELSKDLFLKILEPVKNALQVAKLSKRDLDFVLMVGGSIRMPKVQQVLKDFLNEIPLKFDTSPEETIAQGAAVYAQCILQMLAGKPPRYQVKDITPFTLGVEVKGGKMVPLIPKGTLIPTEQEKFFQTSLVDQDVANIKIFQGESEKTIENHFLSELKLQDITLVPDGPAYIKVVFSYDDSGMLKVTASDNQNRRNQESASFPLYA